jgi:addiction module HigA family antidote
MPRRAEPSLRGLKPTHPGELLREDVLPALGISKAEVARNLRVSRQQLYDILGEKKPVTTQMALRLAKPVLSACLAGSRRAARHVGGILAADAACV